MKLKNSFKGLTQEFFFRDIAAWHESIFGSNLPWNVRAGNKLLQGVLILSSGFYHLKHLRIIIIERASTVRYGYEAVNLIVDNVSILNPLENTRKALPLVFCFFQGVTKWEH